MDSTLTKPTTLLFLVATFCLAGIALAEDDDVHPVTAPVHPPDDSPFSPLPPPSIDPPADSPVSPPLRLPVDPLSDSPVSPLLPRPVDPSAQPPVPHRPEQTGIVAIRGVVFCQSCKHAGSDDLTGALPLNGAVVQVQCKINETVIELTIATYYQGYFFWRKANVNINDFDKCKAYLVSSSVTRCNIPTDLNGGITGAELKREEPPSFSSPYFTLFTVKPFAFLPNCN